MGRSRFTRAMREEIVRDFTDRHGGEWIPAAFWDEVEACRRRGVPHPADDWFERDPDLAARAFWIEQAREFASGIRVVYFQREPPDVRHFTITEVEGPLVISPMANRANGSSYHIFDLENPEHRQEWCGQAGVALKAWMEKYACVFDDVSVRRADIESLVARFNFVADGMLDAAE
jgi:hypothetical protein